VLVAVIPEGARPKSAPKHCPWWRPLTLRH
jgi:hypothetical protein